jgi:hypothetical protein
LCCRLEPALQWARISAGSTDPESLGHHVSNGFVASENVSNAAASWRTPTVVLVCGTIILTLALGVRQTFGLFLQPMSAELGWGRGPYSFTLALSKLIWGAGPAVFRRLGP